VGWFLLSGLKPAPISEAGVPVARPDTPTDRAHQPADQTSERPAVSATISGGAWLTRKSGASEIIRGLEVTVLRSLVAKEVLSKPLASIEERATSYANIWRSDQARSVYGNATAEQLAEVVSGQMPWQQRPGTSRSFQTEPLWS
jgi:hypothetical protein